MLFNKVPTTFLHFSRRSGLNFNAYLMHSLMEDSVTLLNDFCTAADNTFSNNLKYPHG